MIKHKTLVGRMYDARIKKYTYLLYMLSERYRTFIGSFKSRSAVDDFCKESKSLKLPINDY